MFSFKSLFSHENVSEAHTECTERVVYQNKACATQSRKQRFRKIFHSPLAFSILSFLALVAAKSVDGYISAIVSTLEKRFQLTSKELGLLAMTYDVFALTTVLFVTHYGQSRHRPRVIGTLHLINAIAFLVRAVPHFIYPVPSFISDPTTTNSSSNDICVIHNIEEVQCATTQDNQGTVTGEVVWLILGSLLTSFSNGILALTIPYIDDGVNKQSTAIYVAFLLCSYSVGNMLGYFLASVCLSLPAYPNLVHHAGYPKSPSDANWLGAWWLGFLIQAVPLMLIAPLFFLFPKHLPKPVSKSEEDCHVREEGQREDENGVLTVSRQEDTTPAETNEDIISPDGMKQSEGSGTLEGMRLYVITLVKSLWRIFTSIPILCLCVVGALEMASSEGLLLFGTLYMQYQFNLQARFTAIFFGLLIIPSGIFGSFVGGFCIKRFGKTRLKTAAIMIVFTVVVLMFDPVFMIIGCPTARIAGINEHYNYSGSGHEPFPDVFVSCNSDCDCKVEAYDPVCGSDGLTYVSPCFAGCTVNSTILEHGVNTTFYSNCSCIGYDNSTFIGGNGTAISGECRPFCATAFRWFFSLSFMWSGCLTLMAIPAFMLSLRCVADKDRALSLTVIKMCSKILGSVPAPIVFGAVIDKCCRLFQTYCGKEGACLVYDNFGLRLSLYGTITCLHLLALIFTIIATLVIFYQERIKKNWYSRM